MRPVNFWRTFASVASLLTLSLLVPCDAAAQTEAPRQAAGSAKRVLLLAQSPDGHPRGTHEYMAGLRVVKTCLNRVPGVTTTLVKADEPWPEGPELLDQADAAVVFLSEGAKWLQQDAARLAAFQRLATRGGGLSCLHWGMGTRDAKNIDAYVQLFGGCHGGPDRKYKVLGVETQIASTKHPVMTAVAPLKIEEEFYYKLKFAKPAGSITPLLQVPIDGETETVAWAWDRPDKGRSFGFSGLHFHKNWEQASYRRMVLQGALWTLKLPIPEQGLDVAVSEDALRLE